MSPPGSIQARAHARVVVRLLVEVGGADFAVICSTIGWMEQIGELKAAAGVDLTSLLARVSTEARPDGILELRLPTGQLVLGGHRGEVLLMVVFPAGASPERTRSAVAAALADDGLTG